MAVLSDDQIETRLADLDGWSHEDGTLKKTYTFEDFAASVDFVVRITPPAEEMDHHPDIDLRWRTLHLTVVTHSAGGVTELDLELARRMDALLPG